MLEEHQMSLDNVVESQPKKTVVEPKDVPAQVIIPPILEPSSLDKVVVSVLIAFGVAGLLIVLL